MTTTTSAKIKRIIGLDIARAFAIVGMVIVNYHVVMTNGVREPGWFRTSWLHLSRVGRRRLLLCSPASVPALVRDEPARKDRTLKERQAKITLAKRAFFLFVIGWLFFPIWPADILHYYGVYLAIGAVLLFAPGKRLLQVGVGATTISFAFIIGFDYFANWNVDDLSYDGIATVSGFLRNLFFDGIHPVLPWIVFYLFGMWLGRTDLRDPAWRRTLVVRAVAALVVVEGVAWAVLGPKGSRGEDLLDESWQWFFSVEMLPPMPLYLVAGIATACLVIVGSVWLGDHLPARITTPIVHTGQLALTLYVAHVIVGMGTLEEMDRLEDQSLTYIVIASLVFSAAAVVFSTLWRRRYQRGPLEWVMRRLAG